MTLFFVRHGPVHVEPDRPPAQWRLDANAGAVLAAWAGHLPQHPTSHWVSSTEPKAISTAHRLTEQPVATHPDLGEVRRGGWSPHYDATVAEFFADLLTPPSPEWESAAAATRRFVTTVRHLAALAAPDVVVVTHGLVLTLLRSHLGGEALTTRLWKDLQFPDVFTVSEPDRRAWVADEGHRCGVSRPPWLGGSTARIGGGFGEAT